MGNTAEDAASAKVKANTITRPSVRIMELGGHLAQLKAVLGTRALLEARDDH